LWLGNVGDARDLRTVLSAGILAVVDLAADEPPMSLTRDLVYCRFPLIDGTGNSPWLIHSAVTSVVGLISAGIPTLVYCSMGMSRSPAIAGAAIAKFRDCSLADGLTVVIQSGPTDVSPGLLAELQSVLVRQV
jgi:protein-tyrosine phosphatase